MFSSIYQKRLTVWLKCIICVTVILLVLTPFAICWALYFVQFFGSVCLFLFVVFTFLSLSVSFIFTDIRMGYISGIKDMHCFFLNWRLLAENFYLFPWDCPCSLFFCKSPLYILVTIFTNWPFLCFCSPAITFFFLNHILYTKKKRKITYLLGEIYGAIRPSQVQQQ